MNNNQKKKNKIINERKALNSTGAKSPRKKKAMAMPRASFFHWFRFPNRRMIGRNTSPDVHWWLRGAICLAMRALGEQFGVVEGSSGAKMGAQGCPNKKFREFGVPLGAPKSTKRAPERPPGAPKTMPTYPQNILNSISRSQT